jgi:hypothetical protein
MNGRRAGSLISGCALIASLSCRRLAPVGRRGRLPSVTFEESERKDERQRDNRQNACVSHVKIRGSDFFADRHHEQLQRLDDPKNLRHVPGRRNRPAVRHVSALASPAIACGKQGLRRMDKVSSKKSFNFLSQPRSRGPRLAIFAISCTALHSLCFIRATDRRTKSFVVALMLRLAKFPRPRPKGSRAVSQQTKTKRRRSNESRRA